MGILFSTEQLEKASNLTELYEILEQWGSAPYSTHFIEKVKRYWVKHLTNISINVMDKTSGSYKINNTRTLELQEELSKVKLNDIFELLIRRTIQNGEGVIYNYLDANNNKRVKSAQSIVRMLENEEQELIQLEVMDILTSGTYSATLLTRILRDGLTLKYTISYLIGDKAGKALKDKEQSKAKEEFKKNFGYFPTDKNGISKIRAEVLKFYVREDNPAFGKGDIELIKERLLKADIIWNKIIEEVLYRTTSVNIQLENGSSQRGTGMPDSITNTGDKGIQDATLTRIKSKMNKSIKINEFDFGTQDGAEMSIVPDRAEPSLLSGELDKEDLRLHADINMPYNSDTRSFQSSEKEVATGNAGVLDELKYRIGKVQEIYKRILSFFIGEGEIVDIYIPFQDPSVVLQAIKDPAQLLRAGLSRTYIYQILTGKSKMEARSELIDNIDEMKKDAVWTHLMNNTPIDPTKYKGFSFVDKKLLEEQNKSNESGGESVSNYNPPSQKGVK